MKTEDGRIYLFTALSGMTLAFEDVYNFFDWATKKTTIYESIYNVTGFGRDSLL